MLLQTTLFVYPFIGWEYPDMIKLGLPSLAGSSEIAADLGS
ncbi:MAG TPA: hypothetical protein PK239_00140 [Chitinophagales bacterium]|nr:hypothetical protein [Chitinophagales bacterium]HRK25670.1 hypothetical protein [Chitinophagales bacterium]